MKYDLIRAALWAALFFGAVPALVSHAPMAHAESVRPEVGKPLQDAANLLRAQKYHDAMTRINEADAVSGKTPYESYLIARMRLSAAAGEGDAGAAANALDAVTASGRASPAERLQGIEAVAIAYARANEPAKAAQWAQRYLKEGGTDPAIRTMLVQSYYQSNDCPAVARELQNASSEADLQLLANCYLKLNDKLAYASTVERLVINYPKKDYWADLLSRVPLKPGYSSRLDLDLFRLKLWTGNLTQANDYVEMAQLDGEAGLWAEAKRLLDQGYNAKVLGVGPEAARHARLRDLVNKSVADASTSVAQREADADAEKEGDSLVRVGSTEVAAGSVDKGIALMERGIAKGNLKRPDDAKLHLGIAYLMANKKAKARDIFKTVRGTEGTQDLARLYSIYAGAGGQTS